MMMKLSTFNLSFGLLFLLIASSPVVAFQRATPVSHEQVLLSYAPIVKQVIPAVVNIYTKKRVQQKLISPIFEDPVFKQFFGKHFEIPGLSKERVEQSLGSGVIVRPDGYVVTNLHVIKGSDENNN